ncbi:MAG: glycosyltransferase [Anaerolineaceae bacterium]|nr:glycosyltransferase [Anaerolineaceae bacterium]
MHTLSVVVPVYNSEKSLPLLLERLAGVLSEVAARYEVILVNDGSRDQSWPVINELSQRYSFIRAINMMRNYGQHNALLCGIRQANGDVIVTIDDDLQHPPEEIPKLLAKLDEGYDVVYGTPQHESHGLLRDLASQFTKLALQSAMGAQTARQVSAFRVFRTIVRQGFETYHAPFVSIDVLLTWGTTRFTALPVREDERTIGVSNYTFRKLVTHALNMTTGFSVVPLQLSSLMGIGLAGFSVIVMIYVLVRYLLQGTPVPGFPFLASIIGLFSGAQLLALGIMGEYLARMHARLQDRPTYVVREQIGQDVMDGSPEELPVQEPVEQE